jgi:hypothetical protein
MPSLLGVEVSDHTYELNRHLLEKPKQPKTQTRKDLDAELKKQFAATFESTWKLLGGPELETEHYFHPTRQWHSDYLHRPTMTLIELEGGAFSGGRHTRGKGFVEDALKYNTATLLGYRVIRIATGMATPSYLETLIKQIQGIS